MNGFVGGVMAGFALRRVVTLAAVALVLAGCRGNAIAPPSHETVGLLPLGAPLPNVIFVLIDTLRADRLGCYGHTGGLSPTIDSIAAEGVLFEQTHASAPWTQPSIASLFSGMHPGVHKVLNHRKAMERTEVAVFDPSFVTLPEVMQQQGYLTAAFVANLFLLEQFGFSQGFYHYDTEVGQAAPTGPRINAAAEKWLALRDPVKPFFLYLHYMDVHGPYNAPPEYLDPLLDRVEALSDAGKGPVPGPPVGYLNRLPVRFNDEARHKRLWHYRKYWEARYEAGVRFEDDILRDLRERLTRLGVWEKSYVIVTADHGESFFEHGYWEHGWCLHYSDLHVPLILRWPGVLPAGQRVSRVAQLIDVLPTLAMQLRFPEIEGLQGTALVPAISLHEFDAPAVAFAEAVKLGPEQKAILDGEWKLIQVTKPATRKLYHVGKDPREERDLASRERPQLDRLTALLNAQIAENARRAEQRGASAQRVPVDQELVDRLKAIGYLGDPLDPDQPEGPPTDQITSRPATSGAAP